MGVYADDFLELVLGSDDVDGSRWCESSSRLLLALGHADGNFRCGKGTCFLSVLQVPIRVVTLVDWYGFVVVRGLDNSGSVLGLVWCLATESSGRWLGVERGFQLLIWDYAESRRWWVGVEIGFQLLTWDYAGVASWFRIAGARWWARLIGQQNSIGGEGFTDLVVDGGLKVASMVGKRLRRKGGCIKSGGVGVRLEWKWRRWRRRYELVGRCATEAVMVAKGMLKVRDEGDTWQRKGDCCMGCKSRGSTWECSGDRAGPT
ncbi:hypothetical protein V6N11_035732 [Hibiscus sabdariffa]|uniref:Uncharacterized protein n=1 Tax=Hibiscus sabdariffa TaxID=183260 RepID=A0ABR2R918_9ROSI